MERGSGRVPTCPQCALARVIPGELVRVLALQCVRSGGDVDEVPGGDPDTRASGTVIWRPRAHNGGPTRTHSSSAGRGRRTPSRGAAAPWMCCRSRSPGRPCAPVGSVSRRNSVRTRLWRSATHAAAPAPAPAPAMAIGAVWPRACAAGWLTACPTRRSRSCAISGTA